MDRDVSLRKTVMMEEINKKRIQLLRTLSEQPDGFRFSPESFRQNENGTSDLLTRFRSFRKNVVKHSHDSSSPPPVDDVIVLDSYEDVSRDEVISVTVCKEMIYKDLIDLMKCKSGNVQLLYDIESSKITPENITECFQNTSRYERNVAALWSILFRRKDLIEYFISVQVDLDFYEPRQGFGALHISGFSGCTTCTQFLIDVGADVNLSLGSYTPLHCAAFGNSLDTASMLLKAGANISAVQKGSDRLGCDETPLHSAVRAKALDVLQFLLKEGADVNFIEGGTTALHVAADLGYYQCLKMLLESGTANPNVQTIERKYTPIHFAAENGYIDCVKLLLQHGADPNITNFRKQTALHVAAKVCLECVQVFLTDGKCDSNALDADNRTPLHVAVSKSESKFSYEIVDKLIKWHSNVNSQDNYGYTPLHMAALNDLTDCVNILIQNNADVCCRTKGGNSGLGIICKRSPTSISTIQQKLDDCLILKEDLRRKEVVLKYNFRYMLQSSQGGEMTFIETFIDEGLKEFLEHPLCEAFLYLKWEKIRKFYISRLIFYFFYVLLLSVFVFSCLSYQCYKLDHILKNGTNESSIIYRHEISNTSIYNITDALYLCDSSNFGNFLRDYPNVIITVYFVLVILSVFEILRKIYSLCKCVSCVRKYFSQFTNITDAYVLPAVFLTTLLYHKGLYDYQNLAGAISVLLGWTNLMIMIGHLPMFGAYITMYTRVQKEFTKLLLAYSCLLIGFSICFCVIFPRSDQFPDPISGLVKILVMMTGELEFNNLKDDIKKEGSTSGYLLVSALILFTIFLIFITVILMNLLIGIAVHDIQGLKKTAGLSKLVNQANLISQIETSMFQVGLPNKLMKCLRLHALVAPNKYRVLIEVKLLNSKECLVPKDIMRNALDICKQRKSKIYGSVFKQPRFESPTFKRKSANNRWSASDREINMLQQLTKLTQEVQKLRDVVENNNRESTNL